ncbi:MAG TPA: DMT family transporter, partial [Pyrinomonadaceae bacterium]
MKIKADLKADAVLVLTTIIWGSTFPLSKDILDHWPPVAYLVMRMGVSAALMALLFRRQLARAGRAEWRAGATLGLLLAVGMTGLVVGQVYTTAARSAFIAGLTTPLVPFVAYLLTRARPGVENLLGIVLASAGGLLILAPQGEAGAANTGDLLTLGCTVFFAAHLTLMSVYARRYDVRALTVIQIATVSAVLTAYWLALRAAGALYGTEGLPLAVAREFQPMSWEADVLWRFAYMVLVATVLNFLMWTWAQGRMSATHAAIIFSLEPVFATIFAVWMRGAGEWTGGRANLGAALILA